MRTALYLFAFVLISTVSMAQFSYGPRLGLNLNPQPKSDVYKTSYLNSFNGGAFGSYRVNSWLSFKTELNFNTKKKTYQFQTKESFLDNLNTSFLEGSIDTSMITTAKQFINDTVYSNYKGSDALGFIELPLMATVNYKNFEIGAGFYVGYLMKAQNKEELNQDCALLDIVLPAIDTIQFIGPIVSSMLTYGYPGYKEPSVSESTDRTPYLRTDYGFLSEVTYHTNDRLFFSFRYARGFQNYRVNVLRSKDVFNTFTLSMGYTFGAAFSSKPKGIYDLDKVPADTSK